MDYFEIIQQRAASKGSRPAKRKDLNELMINELLPLIFISHCHADQAIAEGLIDLLVEAISIERTEIRATSVPGHKLRAGSNIGDELKQEIAQVGVVLGIVTKQVLESPYVLFELGAAWGLNKPIFPLIAQDINPEQVLGPIASVHRLSLTDNPDCHQLVIDISRQINRSKKTGNDPGIASRVERLVKMASAT